MTKSVFTDEYRLFRKMLTEARESAGLTQTQLAKALRQPQSFVSKYENGKRRLDVIEFLQIADCLRFDAHAFLERLQSFKKKNQSESIE